MTTATAGPSAPAPTPDLPRGVRSWTLILGTAAVIQGLWAFGWPISFYKDFPVPDAEWVSTLGPFNDHLARDFGSALIAIGAITVIACLSDSRAAVRAALIGAVVFGVPHLIFHLTTMGEFSTASISTQIAALVFFIAVPLRLLAVLQRNPATKGTVK